MITHVSSPESGQMSLAECQSPQRTSSQVIPGRTPTSSLSEAFNALLHRLGKAATALFPYVYTASTQGHALLTSQALHNHREYPKTYGMKDDFGIPGGADANVCTCGRHHVKEGREKGGRDRPESAGI